MLNKYGAFPESVAKYLLEQGGIYQDESGKVIRNLVERGEIGHTRVGENPIILSTDSRDAEESTQTCAELIQNLMSGLQNQDSSGLMAELVFYVALSRAHLDLRGEIQMQLWPKGSYPAANGIDWETDCQIVLRGENFPVDVSNSIQQTMTSYDKVQRAAQVKGAGLANPVLINRMASGDVKGQYMRWNSSVCDFGKLIILDGEGTEGVRQSARELEIERFVNWIPPLEVGGTHLTGQSYDDLIHERVRGLPRFGPEVFAEAAGQIPREIVERARGLVEFL